MVHAKISTLVKAIRLRYAVLFVLLLVALYLTVIHPWMANWGSTAAEQQMVLPGDELYPSRIGRSTWAVTIDAPPEVVWQWLAQVGQDRAGFYTYTWLENLTGCEFHNANEIHPEWQHLAAGDAWRLCQPEYLWGFGKDAVVPVLLSEPGHVLALQSLWGAHVILPIDEHASRLLVRSAPGESNLITKLLVDPIVFTMEKRMLLGLKARAERRPDSPPALTAIAQLGWAAAGLVVGGLFVSRRERRYWLALLVAVALPALLTSSDLQAGLAAFLAVGIPLLGFLIFGRSWWGSFLIIASVVLLTLLLAPDAYIAFGLVFLAVLLAALGTVAVARSSARRIVSSVFVRQRG
jgi:hypothetical protein